jgi:hypothetical protein
VVEEIEGKKGKRPQEKGKKKRLVIARMMGRIQESVAI